MSNPVLTVTDKDGNELTLGQAIDKLLAYYKGLSEEERKSDFERDVESALHPDDCECEQCNPERTKLRRRGYGQPLPIEMPKKKDQPYYGAHANGHGDE